jgi:hypothetical protein
MSNMNYCRFRNTETDVCDCLNALEEREYTSEEERKSARRLLLNVLGFCSNEGIIEGFYIERIDKMLDKCKDEREEE